MCRSTLLKCGEVRVCMSGSMLTCVGTSMVVGATWEDWLGAWEGLEQGWEGHSGKRTPWRLLGTPGREGIPLKQDRWGKA